MRGKSKKWRGAGKGGYHFPGCTCVDCTARRLRRLKWWDWFNLKRSITGFGSKLPRLAIKWVLLPLFLLFLGLSAYHWINVGSLNDAPRMALNDFKVAVRCPTKPKTVLQFVDRDALKALAIRVAPLFGEEDWVGEVCDGVFDE